MRFTKNAFQFLDIIMEKAAVVYRVDLCFQLMTVYEKAAWVHWSTNYKMINGNYESTNQLERRRQFSLKSGWLTSDPELLSLLDRGIESFKEKIAN